MTKDQAYCGKCKRMVYFGEKKLTEDGFMVYRCGCGSPVACAVNTAERMRVGK